MGVLLPEFTHVLPELTVFAALGCVVLQVLAIGFHAQRHEITETPFNVLLLTLSAFVLWGRVVIATGEVPGRRDVLRLPEQLARSLPLALPIKGFDLYTLSRSFVFLDGRSIRE